MAVGAVQMAARRAMHLCEVSREWCVWVQPALTLVFILHPGFKSTSVLKCLVLAVLFWNTGNM